MRTVRFAQVVEACGRPRVHTSWLPAEKDRELQRARSAHRVMVITHARGKTDFGSVGLPAGQKGVAAGQILLFPRSLKRFDGARVVGVKFDLVQQPALTSPGPAWRAAPPRQRRPPGRPAETPGAFASPGRRAPPPPAPAMAPRSSKRAKAPVTAAALVREIRAALRALEQGNSVAAYRLLERAVANE
jgi:hypothetical protein